MIRWFTQNGVAANLLMALVCVGGLAALRAIEIKLFPDISLDRVLVSVPYPGAAPAEVERAIILPLEEGLQEIEGIKSIEATAAEGIGTLAIETARGYNLNDVMDRVQVRVDTITTLPEESEKPRVEELTIQQDVILLAVSADASERSLKTIAERVRDDLLKIDGISTVNLGGVRDDEIAIEVTEERLRAYGLTFDELTAAIRRRSLDLPGGVLRTAGGQILLRTEGKATTGAEFENMVLRTSATGTRLRLGDVATVRDGFEDVPVLNQFNGKPAALINIQAVGRETPFEVAGKVYEYIEQNANTFPEGVELTPFGDVSFYLKDRLNMMLENGGLGLLLVFSVLALFLRPSLAFFVALGIPVSFLGTLFVAPWLGVSINLVTLFGFIMVLGIVVDDAIVVGESVFTEIQTNGPGVDSAVRGTHAVATPVTFAILTSVVAFIPLIIVPGQFGDFFGSMAIIVMCTLLWSLVQSKLVLPYHLSLLRFSRNKRPNILQRIQRGFARSLEGYIDNIQRPVLRLCLRYRYATMAFFVGIFLIAAALVASNRIRFLPFPAVPSDYIIANIDMPPGTAFETTRAAATEIRDALLRADQAIIDAGNPSMVQHDYLLVGADFRTGLDSAKASFIIELPKMETRTLSSPELADRWRAEIPPIPGLKSLQIVAEALLNEARPLNYQLSGDNFDELLAATAEVKAALATYDGVFDVSDNYAGGKQELKLRLKPQAEFLGLTNGELAAQVRQAFHGAEAQRVVRGREEVKVMVRYPAEQRTSIGHLEEMMIRTPTGAEVPFGEAVDLDLGTGFPTILRVDRARAVRISADADRDTTDTERINGEMTKTRVPEILAAYPSVRVALAGEAKANQETFQSMATSIPIVLLLMYALLAIPFRSYFQPLIIMSAIPFGLVGAIFGHYLTGQNLSLLSAFGLIALTGVVVNDSLVLVDYVNVTAREGVSAFEAAVEGGARRFRPIILTSATTFVGLVPILLEKSLQAQILIPMATSLAFGVLFATLITLVLVPCLYLVLDDLSFGRKKKNHPAQPLNQRG